MAEYNNADPRHVLALALLGAHVMVRCVSRQCAEDIKGQFHHAVIEPWRSPDVVVDILWERAGRYLFRSRPDDADGPLEGVRVHTRGQLADGWWPSRLPPVPPFPVPPFRNQFVGLHGGAVRTPSGDGLLILGARRAGETTLSLALANHHECQLLTDETVVIHKRTRVAEPFLRDIKVWTQQTPDEPIRSTRLAAVALCSRLASSPVVATHLLFLQPGDSDRALALTHVTPAVALRQMLEHHLDLGCDADEAMVTIFDLVKCLPAAVLTYGSYEQLRHEGPAAALEFVARRRVIL